MRERGKLPEHQRSKDNSHFVWKESACIYLSIYLYIYLKDSWPLWYVEDLLHLIRRGLAAFTVTSFVMNWESTWYESTSGKNSERFDPKMVDTGLLLSIFTFWRSRYNWYLWFHKEGIPLADILTVFLRSLGGKLVQLSVEDVSEPKREAMSFYCQLPERWFKQLKLITYIKADRWSSLKTRQVQALLNF